MADLTKLLERAHKGGEFTLNEIRDYFGPMVPEWRRMELVIRVHQGVQDLSEAERICALLGALMMELI